MSVRVVGYVDESLMARLVERAAVEQRTLSNMVGRLIELGLGTVVTERDGSAGVATDLGTPGGRLRGTADQAPAPSRSVTVVCVNERMHRSGVFCKACGRTV